MRKGLVGLVAAALGMLLGSGVATAQDTVPTPPQASATVTGLPTVSGSLEDETIRVLIENCEVGTAIITIDDIEVATVTITADAAATAASVEAAATGEVVVAIPDGAEPPYDVDVTCSNGVASTVVNLPTAQVPETDDDAQAPGAGGGAGDGEGSLPLTGGGSTLVPLARGAAVAVAAGALMVLATRTRRETATV
ncbi:MAG: acid shock protein [Actinomycetota bacterium]